MAMFEDYNSYHQWYKDNSEPEFEPKFETELDYVKYELQLEKEKNLELGKALECATNRYIDAVTGEENKKLKEENQYLHDKLATTEMFVVGVSITAAFLFQWI